MAYLPPVSIPSLSSNNYAAQLHGLVAAPGEAVYQNRRDRVEDEQWQQVLDRGLANDALAQANADRNYALELRKLEEGGGAAGAFGLNGIWGYNQEAGKWGYFQPNKAGGAASQVEFPEGFDPMPPTSNANLGTVIQPIANRGGVPVGGALPIDVAGKGWQEQVGAAGGKIASALPVIEQSSARMIGGIDDLLQDPMLPAVTGPVGGNVPTFMSTDPGGAFRAQSRVDFILGNTFLQAYNDLRGAGQITEAEGQAAMAAYSRLRTQGMSDEDYASALLDLRNEIVKLTEIARQRAQMGAPGGGQPPPQGQPVFTSPGGFQIFEGQ